MTRVPHDDINQNPERCQCMFGIGYQELSDLIGGLVSSCAPAEVNETGEQAGDNVSIVSAEDSQSLIYVTNTPSNILLSGLGETRSR